MRAAHCSWTVRSFDSAQFPSQDVGPSDVAAASNSRRLSHAASASGRVAVGGHLHLSRWHRRSDVERDAEVAVLGADFLERRHAGEAGFVLERLVGLDDALDVVVGEKALGPLAGDFVDGVDEQDLAFARLAAWPCGR